MKTTGFIQEYRQTKKGKKNNNTEQGKQARSNLRDKKVTGDNLFQTLDPCDQLFFLSCLHSMLKKHEFSEENTFASRQIQTDT
jgi:hypothetical protein